MILSCACEFCVEGKAQLGAFGGFACGFSFGSVTFCYYLPRVIVGELRAEID